MSLRSPTEAFEAFIDPIARAASTLGAVKVTPSPGGRSKPDALHAWSLNLERGVVFSRGYRYEAQMHYRIVQRPMSGDWKVETLGYRYQLALQGRHLWRIHWHPTVTSTYHGPHVHLSLWDPSRLPTDDSLKRHYPTGRITFEDSLEWVFNEGIEPAREDWKTVIAETKESHVARRSWHTEPPPALDP